MPFSKPLPIVTKALVSVAICLASSAPAYANAACQGGNCVLPVRDAPPPPPVAEPVAIVDEGGGLGILPILGLVALAAIVALLVLDNDNDDEDEPVSP